MEAWEVSITVLTVLAWLLVHRVRVTAQTTVKHRKKHTREYKASLATMAIKATRIRARIHTVAISLLETMAGMVTKWARWTGTSVMETIEIGTKAIANSLAVLVATHNIRWVVSVVT